MPLRRFVRVTNTRVRLLVGLGLLTLVCLQCTQSSEATKETPFVTAINGQAVGTMAPDTTARLETLARTDPLGLLRLCLDHYDKNYSDVQCTFVKRERIQGRLGQEQWIDVKHTDAPFSVAMQWTRNAPLSDRALYVEGSHGGNMLVKPKGMLGGLVGTVQRQPDSDDVMENTLRPITMFGFRRTLEQLIAVSEQADAAGEMQTEFLGYRQVDGRAALALQRILPAGQDYPARKTLVYIDAEWLVPIRIEAWDWDDQLTSQYTFKDIRFNTGLTPQDFLPAANGL